jgi:nitrate/nitrite transport system ATP-binding protein
VPFIQAQRLSKSFAARAGVRHVLRDVSLSVEEGEFVSIVGAMGSGKSTLLAILAGLQKADAGTVTLAGDAVEDVPRRASFVFQNYSLLPWLTALENVRLAVESACPELSKDEQRARSEDTLALVGLGNATGRRPRQLSGGMRQRVAIARAFATRPDVLFLDEPFGALDALTRETLQQELGRLCSAADRSATVVMITNSIEEAILLSDRIVPMIPGPPATLGEAIPVTLPRPRTTAAFEHDEDAARTRTQIIAALAAAVGGRARKPAPMTAKGHGAVTLARVEDQS